MLIPDLLSIHKLCKCYGERPAVDAISFRVAAGEIVGLLGPNGAGKTTTINLVLGVLAPTSGTIMMNGMDIIRQRSAVLKQMNFAAVYAPLPGNLTVEENLYIFALLYSVRQPKQRIAELMEEFDLIRFRRIRCGVLSSGEQTRVSLAKALLNEPRLLLLDEPTASLDPAIARDIRGRIREYHAQRRGAILWTSHNMQEVETVCDRVLFLSRGKILLEGDPRTLPAQYGKAGLEDLFVTVAQEPLSLSGEPS